MGGLKFVDPPYGTACLTRGPGLAALNPASISKLEWRMAGEKVETGSTQSHPIAFTP